MRPGPRDAITDVAGLRVGHAHDAELRSGVTVLVGDAPLTAAVHIMGGAPGTRETELLAPDKLVRSVDALCLSGGSAFGLAACDGVMASLAAQGRGFAVGPARVPIVPGAILFDLLNGGRKDWVANPYPALGEAAFSTASTLAAESGSIGAGYGASVMGMRGGLGTTSAILENGTRVGALVAVNAVGRVCDSRGRFFAAGCDLDGSLGPIGMMEGGWEPEGIRGRGEATTIAVVATDASLDQSRATRLAVAAHDGLARAIAPSHTPLDGDLVFAVATGVPSSDEIDPWSDLRIGHAAARCLSRAIAIAIRDASPCAWSPCWAELYG
jgi:D-aminopeptidase